MKYVGYLINKQRCTSLHFDEARAKFLKASIELINIDPSFAIEKQGKFDLIIHKTYKSTSYYLERIKNYSMIHPECVILDPLDKFDMLDDRFEQINILQKWLQTYPNSQGLFIPSSVLLTTSDKETNIQKLREANITYPVMVKPLMSKGTKISHEMTIVFCESNLNFVKPPCVAQTLINHNAELYKIYVLGDMQFIRHRPSIKNFHAGERESILFDTRDVSRKDSLHTLNVQDPDDLEDSTLKPDMEELKMLGKHLSSYLGLNLLGVDVIIDCTTKRYGIIDVNQFPGYNAESDIFFDGFLELIMKLLKISQRTHIE